MKITYSFFVLIFFFALSCSKNHSANGDQHSFQEANNQKIASFTPLIKGDTMLCPDGGGMLYLANKINYDSLQWYQTPYFPANSKPVAMIGQTRDSLYVDANTESPATFTLEVFKGKKHAFSNELNVNGWVFRDPTLLVQGDFTLSDLEEFVIAKGDTLLASASTPFEKLNTWYKDQKIIATNQKTIRIYKAGSYSYNGSAVVCPNSIFDGPTIQVIVTGNDSTPSPYRVLELHKKR